MTDTLDTLRKSFPGCYMESSKSLRTQHDVTLVCAHCGKRLMEIPKGEFIFIQTHGDCTCSWACCELSTPGNERHPRHLTHVND